MTTTASLPAVPAVITKTSAVVVEMTIRRNKIITKYFRKIVEETWPKKNLPRWVKTQIFLQGFDLHA